MRTQSEWNVEISGRVGESLRDSRSASRRDAATWFGQAAARGPLLHFAGRFLGERDGEDALRLRAAADQLGDAIGDDPRLAGARAGEHQQRPAERPHGVELRRVQIGRHRKSVSKVSIEWLMTGRTVSTASHSLHVASRRTVRPRRNPQRSGGPAGWLAALDDKLWQALHFSEVQRECRDGSERRVRRDEDPTIATNWTTR